MHTEFWLESVTSEHIWEDNIRMDLKDVGWEVMG
jgi:hypothetical protein